MNHEYLKTQLGRYISAPTNLVRQDSGYRLLTHMAGSVSVFGSPEADTAAIAQFDVEDFDQAQLTAILETAQQVLLARDAA